MSGEGSCSLAGLLTELATAEGFVAACLPDVRLMRSTETYPSAPVSYDPSVVIIARGRKRGRLGGRVFTYDALDYLVLSVPLRSNAPLERPKSRCSAWLFA